ncbi:MAG TPA: suppressor of fused domain protein [Methylobacterium sp.]|uniref:suppressor of fused domain protein n=1 Tax=Methylorubrum sp. B1-46 TaxID=2897334 RepID=UPI001E350F98|nr:suppressor of fused domain protein [Methylorubrum sp. B1-46]UGB24616.1 suppressor of fused domain protein [Methylorubrum sp. B1-46]HEV2543723.1 suppressor of fused domain protein [Methylobacterium sp.]
MSDDYDDDDDEASGWQAIDGALSRLYPNEKPQHYATPLTSRPMMGGRDPLDGFSVWKRLAPVPHWHFLTYGFSELYAKENDEPQTSGYGFELTLRLRCDAEDVEPPAWVFGLFQNMARYVFSSGNVFSEGEQMSANGPIARDEPTAMTYVAFARDPELAPITTPFGRLTFLQVVGLTEDEADAARRWHIGKLLDIFGSVLPLLVTDLRRPSLLGRPEIRRSVDEGIARDGSSSGLLFVEQLSWSCADGPTGRPTYTVTIGTSPIADLIAILPLRLPFGRDLVLFGSNLVRLEPGEETSVAEESDGLVLRLSEPTARALSATLKPEPGTYAVPGFDAVRWLVECRDSK